MAEREFFVGPKDVSDDAGRKAKRRPQIYAIALIASFLACYLAIALLGEFGAIFLVLVPTLLGCLILSLRDSSRVRKVLRDGELEEVYELNDDLLTHELRSRRDPNERLAFEAFPLDELRVVNVSSDGLSLADQDGASTFCLPNSSFVNDQARQDFTAFLLQVRSANEERES